MIGCPAAFFRLRKSPCRHSGSGTVNVPTEARLAAGLVIEEETRGPCGWPADVAAELIALEAALLMLARLLKKLLASSALLRRNSKAV